MNHLRLHNGSRPVSPKTPSNASPLFSKSSSFASSKIKSATVYLTAHGLYEATINGKRIGNAYFAPGWTSYEHRLEYQAYNVTPLLKKGANAIVVTVAEGWYRGAFGHYLKRNNYGSDAALLCALHIQYAAGSIENILSDSTWTCSTGPIIYSDLYDGEIFDARRTPQNWWPVTVKDFRKDHLSLSQAEPITQHERIKPKRIFITPKGEQVIDFGQNISGRIQFSIKGNAGDTIKISHAELLDSAGNFYSGNLRKAKATDIYILKGGATESFAPHLTYHGFRYAKVEGCKANANNFTAIALYNDMSRTGTFACSNPMLNRLHQNIAWSLKSNFVSIPTDCPQRSERLGWTGDAQVFAKAAGYHYNVNLFFRHWLKDLATDQGTNGAVPIIVPDLYGHLNIGAKRGVAGWGDAATIIPWTLFQLYNDTGVLRDQYASMKAWVEYIRGESRDGLWTANGYGDWLAPGDSTSLPYIDQCFWGYSTELLVRAARVLGRDDEAVRNGALLRRVKETFLRVYMGGDGRAITHTQTAYVLALQFDMLQEGMRAKAAAHLVELIRNNGYRLATGFLGTPYLSHVLSDNGYTDVAYRLLLQKECPSWLYPITKGATTIWEKWDAIKPYGTIQAASFNHYAYGAVGDWLYEGILGIKPLEPGFTKILIAPQVGGGLTWARGRYKCSYGTIVCYWRFDNGNIIIKIEIPKNITATVVLPNGKTFEVGAGRYVING